MITAIQGPPPIVIAPSDNNKAETQEQKNPAVISADDAAYSLTKKENISAGATEEKNKADKDEKDKKLNFSSLEEKIKSKFQFEDVTFKFSIDSDTKELILKLVDSHSGDVIRQIPSELSMKIARFVANELEQGQLTDAKV